VSEFTQRTMSDAETSADPVGDFAQECGVCVVDTY
jgi:hypothetical protein